MCIRDRLRCEGKSGVQVTGRYAPGINETCISGRDLCISEIVDFWQISGDKAIPSNLLGDDYIRDPQFGRGKMSAVLYYDEKTGNTLQINPTTGEYYFSSNLLGENQMTREGICEKFSDKKLFKR